MKVYYKTPLIMILLVSFLSACEKETNQIPAKTNEGRNTIGYSYLKNNYDEIEIIKGGVFGDLKDSFTFGSSEIKLVYNERLKFEFNWRYYGILTLHFSYDDPSDIMLTDAKYKAVSDRFIREDQYLLDSSKTNFMEISYVNQERKILSGLFDLNFVLIDSVYEDDSLILKEMGTRHLTNGRFDVMEVED